MVEQLGFEFLGLDNVPQIEGILIRAEGSGIRVPNVCSFCLFILYDL